MYNRVVIPSEKKYQTLRQTWKPDIPPSRLLPWLIAFISLAAAASALTLEALSTTHWPPVVIVLISFLIFAGGLGFIYLAVVQILRLVSERRDLADRLAAAEANRDKILRRLEAVFQIHQKFVETADEGEIIDLALQSAVNLAGASGAMYVPLDDRGQPMAAIPYSDQPYPIPDVWAEYLASPAVRERCRVCDKTQPLAESCPLMAEPFHGPQGLFCLPLKRGEHEFGVINLHVPESGGFDSETQSFLRAMANQTALALESHRLRKLELQTLKHLQTVRDRNDLRAQIADLMDNARASLEADFVVLRVSDPNMWPLTAGPLNKADQEVIISGEASQPVLQLLDGFITGVISSHEPLIVANAVGENPGSRRAANAPVRAILAVPLAGSGDHLIGVLLAGSGKPQRFSARQLSLLQSTAGQVALILQTAMQVADVRYQSMLDERTRLAREIHDGLAQTLGFLKLQMTQLMGYFERDETDRLNKSVKVIYHTLSEAYQEARFAIDGLRISPESNGFEWVEQIIAEFNENTAGSGPEVFLRDNNVKVFVPPEIQAQLIRILQEALSNVRKHANATRVEVSFCQGNQEVVLQVADNGIGFSADEVTGPSRHGLRGMRERAELIGADFQVVSRPEEGTIVRVSLPAWQGELEK